MDVESSLVWARVFGWVENTAGRKILFNTKSLKLCLPYYHIHGIQEE